MSSKIVKHHHRRFDAAVQQKFLDEFSKHGMVIRAAEAVGVHRMTVHKYVKDDPNFAERFHEARDRATEVLEAEAWRRAVHGVREPLVSMGEIVGHKQVYSDTLLCLLLRANAPTKYRDNLKVDATIAAGVLVMPATMSPSEWEKQALEQQSAPPVIEHQPAGS